MKYATRSSRCPCPWNIVTVDSGGNTGYDTSIALDTNNVPHISYIDDSDGELKYEKKVQGRWVLQIVDSQGDFGWWSSIKIDPSSGTHISYYSSSNGDLKWALVS